MVNTFHRKLAFWVPVTPEPLFLVSSRIFSSTNKLRASHQSILVISFYTVPQRSRRIHVVCMTCKSASERYYIPPPPAHQPTLHVWDMRYVKKQSCWNTLMKTRQGRQTWQHPQTTWPCTYIPASSKVLLFYQFSQKPTFLCAGGFLLHSTFFQNMCSINVSGKFLPTWKHQRTSFL